MIVNQLAFISNVIFSTMCLVIAFRSAKYIGKNDRSMTAIFFTFSVTSLFLSYLYWLAYDLLRPGIRMPFAANEVGEMACCLLLASAIVTVFGNGKVLSYKEAVFGIILQIYCVFLWIGWSGEWVQDIISGIVICYLVYVAVKALIITEAFTRAEWRFQGAVLAFLVVLETIVFIVPSEAKKFLDTVCYILILLICVFYGAKTIKAFMDKGNSRVFLSISCISFIYGMNAMYMSTEPFYFVAELFDNLMLVFVYLAIRRVVTEE